jgi:hypothetical protein
LIILPARLVALPDELVTLPVNLVAVPAEVVAVPKLVASPTRLIVLPAELVAVANLVALPTTLIVLVAKSVVFPAILIALPAKLIALLARLVVFPDRLGVILANLIALAAIIYFLWSGCARGAAGRVRLPVTRASESGLPGGLGERAPLGKPNGVGIKNLSQGRLALVVLYAPTRPPARVVGTHTQDREQKRRALSVSDDKR